LEAGVPSRFRSPLLITSDGLGRLPDNVADDHLGRKDPMTVFFKSGYLALTIAILMTAIGTIATASIYPANSSDPILGEGWRCWRLAGFTSCSRTSARDLRAVTGPRYAISSEPLWRTG